MLYDLLPAKGIQGQKKQYKPVKDTEFYTEERLDGCELTEYGAQRVKHQQYVQIYKIFLLIHYLFFPVPGKKVYSIKQITESSDNNIPGYSPGGI